MILKHAVQTAQDHLWMIFTTGQYQFESERINFRNITFILTVIIDLVLTAAILRLSDQNICRVNTGVPVDSN